ncbi:hypothetical protein C8J57DRAFT_1678758 [Mycena rebaudengoi]|nr:hypothetical protein C8J57DRAFT_1678758 [Mycena rebaudengoi]
MLAGGPLIANQCVSRRTDKDTAHSARGRHRSSGAYAARTPLPLLPPLRHRLCALYAASSRYQGLSGEERDFLNDLADFLTPALPVDIIRPPLCVYHLRTSSSSVTLSSHDLIPLTPPRILIHILRIAQDGLQGWFSRESPLTRPPTTSRAPTSSDVPMRYSLRVGSCVGETARRTFTRRERGRCGLLDGCGSLSALAYCAPHCRQKIRRAARDEAIEMPLVCGRHHSRALTSRNIQSAALPIRHHLPRRALHSRRYVHRAPVPFVMRAEPFLMIPLAFPGPPSISLDWTTFYEVRRPRVRLEATASANPLSRSRAPEESRARGAGAASPEMGLETSVGARELGELGVGAPLFAGIWQAWAGALVVLIDAFVRGAGWRYVEVVAKKEIAAEEDKVPTQRTSVCHLMLRLGWYTALIKKLEGINYDYNPNNPGEFIIELTSALESPTSHNPNTDTSRPALVSTLTSTPLLSHTVAQPASSPSNDLTRDPTYAPIFFNHDHRFQLLHYVLSTFYFASPLVDSFTDFLCRS